ncbi:TetR/AcrR family transcriptional regulator [Candidatus Magnetaquicoccus inordinatus]|uniref:TetR/AcrR family transcriptional regulator n=1 Tax=Candidatus Magnetaquicoccus inordinatus TaxID=2496818 RepID=UPI00102C74AF|nr:TetR/AcrR family transcriptional regulator [Candidatus Magnetaquicoccus inordinatus]
MTNSPPQRGRPRDPKRFKRVMEAATRQFCEQGYERTSIDSVAQEAAVSKVTIYSYFSTKEQLFEAVVGSYSDQVFANLPPELLDPQQPERALTHIGEQFLHLIFSEEAIGIFRALIGSATQQNTACQLFFRRGPEDIMRQVAQYMHAAQQANSLTINDPLTAADHFLSLLMGRAHLLALFGLASPTPEQKQTILQQSLSLFLNACRKTSLPS